MVVCIRLTKRKALDKTITYVYLGILIQKSLLVPNMMPPSKSVSKLGYWTCRWIGLT